MQNGGPLLPVMVDLFEKVNQTGRMSNAFINFLPLDDGKPKMAEGKTKGQSSAKIPITRDMPQGSWKFNSDRVDKALAKLSAKYVREQQPKE